MDSEELVKVLRIAAESNSDNLPLCILLDMAADKIELLMGGDS